MQLLDCDVEEPNCHLFLRPQIESSEPVYVEIPVIDNDACTHCGECSSVCVFNALACLKDAVMVFPELCHGCGACWTLCPVNAIKPGKRECGVVEQGNSRTFDFAQGRLRIGEAMAPPVIRAVRALERAPITLIDAPPGTTCPVVSAIRKTDYVLLVTEPTPFGLNDLRLAVDLVRQMGLPCGVFINRAGECEGELRAYCTEARLPILATLPDDRRIAQAYSRGEILVDALPEYRVVFAQLGDALLRSAEVRL